jgi:hypothetical protein
MAVPVTFFRLFPEPDEAGLCCGKNSLTLGGIALLAHGGDGLEPRPEDELQSVFDAAYGIGAINALTRLPGIRAVANALNAGDLCRATICSLLLKMPDIDEAGVERLSEFATTRKANFNPAEPRRKGRWTSDGTANSNVVRAQFLPIPMPFPMPPPPVIGYPGGPKRKYPYPFPNTSQSEAGHPTVEQSQTNADARATTSEDQPKVCPSSTFEPSSTSRTDQQRLYQAQIGELPLDFQVIFNAVSFDGCRESDGTLLEAKTNNGWFLGIRPDEFRAMKEYRDMVGQAFRQSIAAGNRNVEWNFNQPMVAYYWRNEFARLGIGNISVKYTAADEFYEPPSVNKIDIAKLEQLYARWA